VTSGRALVRAGLLVTGAYFVSRVLGWVRLVVIGTTFGTQGALDPFFAAFRIPDMIFQLVAAGALASALIPTIATLVAHDEEDRAWRVVSTVTNLMLAGLAVLAGLLLVFAPAVVPAITPGFDAAQTSSTVDLTRVMLLSPIFLALGSVATSVLQARGRFVASVLAPIVYNLAIIGGAIFLAPSMGVMGVAVGVVAGSALHLVVQLYPLLGPTRFRYHPRVDMADPEARTTILLLVPRAIGLGGAQLQLLAATTIASTLAAGSITAFNFAFTFFQIPIGTLGVPLGIVAFPALSERLASGATGDFVSLLGRSLRLMLFAMLPIAVVAAVAARPVVTLLIGYGKVDAAGIEVTAQTLIAFMVALPSETAIVLLARAFYAARDTRTPVAAALVAVALSIAISIALAPALGVVGLALGIAIASWLEAIILLVRLDRLLPTLDVAAITAGGLLAAICSAAAGAAAWLVLEAGRLIVGPAPGKIGIAGELVVVGLVSVGVYLGCARLLRIPEVPTIVRLLRSALGRGAAA
jgi:putative peptidoglycan lipid II flippase